jgi:hypothetical protein
MKLHSKITNYQWQERLAKNSYAVLRISYLGGDQEAEHKNGSCLAFAQLAACSAIPSA